MCPLQIFQALGGHTSGVKDDFALPLFVANFDSFAWYLRVEETWQSSGCSSKERLGFY
jgi:hypothetical protein